MNILMLNDKSCLQDRHIRRQRMTVASRCPRAHMDWVLTRSLSTGSKSFHKPIIGSSDWAKQARALLEDQSIQHVTVIGSGISAYDCVYLLASSRRRATWLIRASGHGPTCTSPAHIYIYILDPFCAGYKVWSRFVIYVVFAVCLG